MTCDVLAPAIIISQGTAFEQATLSCGKSAARIGTDLAMIAVGARAHVREGRVEISLYLHCIIDGNGAAEEFGAISIENERP
jgi:hypothetical protein